MEIPTTTIKPNGFWCSSFYFGLSSIERDSEQTKVHFFKLGS